jgi:hypothetical protein
MPDPTRATISATQSPALWNVSPYLTRWMLWQHFANGVPLDVEPNSRMDWGLKMQPLVLEQAAAELRLEVIPNENNTYHRCGMLGCTRDATIICPDRGPGALETKCVFDYATWMRDWDGGKLVPRHHEIQLQQQIFVGDGEGQSFGWGIIVAWVGADLFYFERKPIIPLVERLAAEAAAFFASVEAKGEPDPFGSPIEVPWLTELFPTERGKVLDLSQDHLHVKTAELVSLYAHHKSQESEGKKGAEPIRAKLLALARDAEKVLLPCGVNFKIGGSEKAKRLTVYVPDNPTPAPMAASQEILHAG